jgi:hypothetical protein
VTRYLCGVDADPFGGPFDDLRDRPAGQAIGRDSAVIDPAEDRYLTVYLTGYLTGKILASDWGVFRPPASASHASSIQLA